MKSIFIKTIAFLTVCVILFSCVPDEPITSSEIYLLVDVTASVDNKIQLNFDAQKIAELSGLNDNLKSMKVTYSHSILSEVSMNQEFSKTLEPANPKSYNKYRRKNAVKKYLASLDEGITKLNNVEFDRPSSNLFVNINETINKIAKNSSDNQLVIIQSDMLNHSREFSAYDKGQMKQLEKLPEFLPQILEQHAPIKQSLQKMKVVIVYQPIDTKTDYAFRLISSQYRNYLLSKGIQSVEIVANL